MKLKQITSVNLSLYIYKKLMFYKPSREIQWIAMFAGSCTKYLAFGSGFILFVIHATLEHKKMKEQMKSHDWQENG